MFLPVRPSLLLFRTDSYVVFKVLSRRISASRYASSFSLLAKRYSLPKNSANLVWYLRSRIRRLI